MSDKSPHLFFANSIITESNIADGNLLCLNSGQFLCLWYRHTSEQFFRLRYGVPLRPVSLFTLWGPSQTCFFAYYMGPPKSVLGLLYGAPSDQYLCIIYGAPQISFFIYYVGATEISFIAYYMGPPQVIVSSLTIWIPSDQFLCNYIRGSSD